MTMGQLRIGIIGLGNMGLGHAKALLGGAVTGAVLTAVCESDQNRHDRLREELNDTVKLFSNEDDFLASGIIDGVLIATPHYDHPRLAIKAFDHELHVLIEKPAGVYTKQVREMNERAAASDKVYSIMYNQRTNPMYQKLRELIVSGELGEIRRTNWIITNWYRPQAYYNSGSWRATWEGEGGGVLINQCPHQLDLWHWTTLLKPKRMRAFCQFGKHRDIEVENEMTAYVEYENGGTGVFITTTAEAPGTNRFEVAGTKGKIVIEDGKLSFWRLRQSEPEFNAVNTASFASPECWTVNIPLPSGEGPQHIGIIQDWTNAILHGTPLLAPGEDGIDGLMLSNAMLLSTWTDSWVDFPIDEEKFQTLLEQKIAESRETKKVNV